MQFEIVFLGTASAIPTAKKNHSGFLIKTDKHQILVDCGEGIQRQYRKAEENASKLTKLLITHWHEDHTIGIPPLLKSLGMNEYSKNLEIYGPRGTSQNIEMFERIYRKYKIPFLLKEVNDEVIYEDEDLLIETKSLKHSVATNGYSIILKDKVRIDKKKIAKLKLPNSPLIGQLQKGKDIVFEGKKIKSKDVTYVEEGKKITVILDTAMTENAITLAKGADLLICESSFSKDEEERAEEYLHLTSTQAATIAKKAKVKALALVHISQKHEFHIKDLVKEAQSVFPNSSAPDDLAKIII